MPDHDAAADATDLIFTNQHLGAGSSSCEPEIDGGVVVGRNQIAGAPQLDDIRLVFRRSTPDDQWHNGGLPEPSRASPSPATYGRGRETALYEGTIPSHENADRGDHGGPSVIHHPPDAS